VTSEAVRYPSSQALVRPRHRPVPEMSGASRGEPRAPAGVAVLEVCRDWDRSGVRAGGRREAADAEQINGPIAALVAAGPAWCAPAEWCAGSNTLIGILLKVCYTRKGSKR
jgi:hypothetical protein